MIQTKKGSTIYKITSITMVISKYKLQTKSETTVT